VALNAIEAGMQLFLRTFLIYCDGVSEGQYDMVLSQELPQLRKACQDVYLAPDTKKGLLRFTVVICGKRYKTRFYPTNYVALRTCYTMFLSKNAC
jgi:eukaryotic translation initiation factor 2C